MWIFPASIFSVRERASWLRWTKDTLWGRLQWVQRSVDLPGGDVQRQHLSVQPDRDSVKPSQAKPSLSACSCSDESSHFPSKQTRGDLLFTSDLHHPSLPTSRLSAGQSWSILQWISGRQSKQIDSKYWDWNFYQNLPSPFPKTQIF